MNSRHLGKTGNVAGNSADRWCVSGLIFRPCSVLNSIVCLVCVLGLSRAAFATDLPSSAQSVDSSRPREMAVQTILGETPYTQSSLELRHRTLSLPAPERFNALKHFVLPGHDQIIRFDFEFSPTHPTEGLSGESVGGELIAPVIDLVRCALEVNELSKLRQEIEAIHPADLLSQRKQLAILIMIASLDSRNDDALTLLDQFNQLSAQEQAHTSSTIAPELILLRFLRDYPEAYDVFVPNADRIGRKLRLTNGHGVWGRGFRNLWGRQARIPRNTPPIEHSTQWYPYTTILAETRGMGIPDSNWSLSRGRADNLASHGHDYLCFVSPLAGDFLIECDASLFDWSETRLVAKGTWINPIYDYEHYDSGGIATGLARNPIIPPLTRMQQSMHLRTAVHGNQLSAFVNGRPIHQQTVTEHDDPWVGIRCGHVQEGSAFDVRISGNPTIPDTIYLTARTPLEGWIPYFGDVVGMTNSLWRHPPNALSGLRSTVHVQNQNPQIPHSFDENAIFYHRPVLEDGTIEYEFLFQEGMSNASPILDRLCLRPQPDGVHSHWLTDGRFHRTLMPPDNDELEASCQLLQGKLNLKNGEWNSAAIRVQGNTIEFIINGEPVFHRSLESTNQRYFGFFYFADQEELQVRNVRWTGNWPKTLPAVRDQELANPEQFVPDPLTTPFAASYEHNFATQGVSSGGFSFIHGNPSQDVQQQPDGTLLQVTGTSGYRNTTIAPQIEVHGDFDIVATYDRFETNPPPKGSSSLTLNLKFQTPTADEAAVTRRHMHDNADVHRQIVQCIALSRIPEGEKREHFVTRNCEERSGRLRISRRGKLIYYLSAEGDSPHDRLWGKREITDAPIDLNGIRLQTQIHENGSTSVVLKTLNVNADQITGIGPDADHPAVLELNQKREQLPAKFLFDFVSTPPSPNTFYRWMDTRPWTENAKGLEIVSQGSDSWMSAGITTLQQMRGDFDIEAQLADIRLATPVKGQGTGVFLQADFSDPLDTQVSAIYSLNDSGGYDFGAQTRTRTSNGEFAYHKFANLSTNSPASSLRMARMADSLVVLVRNNEQQAEMILGRTPITDADVISTKVLLHTGGAGRQSQMLLKSFRIHAQDYEPSE